MKSKNFYHAFGLVIIALVLALEISTAYASADVRSALASGKMYIEGDALVVFRSRDTISSALNSVTGSVASAASIASIAATSAARSDARVVKVWDALTAESFKQGAKVAVASASDGDNESQGGIFAHLHSDIYTTKELVENLLARDDVIAAAPNYITHGVEMIPNDTLYSNLGLWGLKAINAPSVWDTTQGADDIYIAVLDTGLDYSHLDIKDNFDSQYSKDFCQGDYMDYNGHGTHVAGTIAAVGNNARGITGVNWKAKIMVLSVMGSDGSGSISNIVNAVDYLVSTMQSNANLKVAAFNMSLAYYSHNGQSQDPVYQAMKTLDNMNRIVMVVAAGNDGIDLAKGFKGQNVFPAAYTGINNLITVAAADSKKTRASFSNYNRRYVKLAAPGVNILSTFSSKGSDSGNFKPLYLDGIFVSSMSGTSMASPHVAGAAALLKAAHPDATAWQITKSLCLGANSNVLAGNTSKYGFLDLDGALKYLTAGLADGTLEKEPSSDNNNDDDDNQEQDPTTPYDDYDDWNFWSWLWDNFGYGKEGIGSVGCSGVSGVEALVALLVLPLKRNRK